MLETPETPTGASRASVMNPNPLEFCGPDAPEPDADTRASPMSPSPSDSGGDPGSPSPATWRPPNVVEPIAETVSRPEPEATMSAIVTEPAPVEVPGAEARA